MDKSFQAPFLFSCGFLMAFMPVALWADPTTQQIAQQMEQQRAQQRQQANQVDELQQQRQQQQNEQLTSQFGAKADVQFEKPALQSLQLPPQENPCFPIKNIHLIDYASSEKSQFIWAYENAIAELGLHLPYCLGGEGLNVLVRKIQNLIIDKGYVTTRVVVGEQDLRQAELELTVIPGRLRHVFIEDKSAVAKFTALGAWTAIVPQQGSLLNVKDIEQSLENLKRVPTADANINILPAEGEGAEVGQSDLQVQYAQAFPFRLTLGLDDSGSTSTGRWQGSITLSLDNTFTANDLFYTSFTHSLKRPNWTGVDDKGPRRSENLSFYYSVPWHYWTFTATHSRNQYHQQVAAAYGSKLMYSGKSESNKLSLSRTIFRNNQHKTQLTASFWTRQSFNFIEGEELLIQRKRTAGWELGLQHRVYLGNAQWDFGVNYRRGTGAYHAMPYPDEKFNEGSSRMKIISASIALAMPFGVGEQRFVFSSSWNGQWNKTPLVLQDQFSLGGRYTVRGTDGELSLSGERGWLWRNELAWNLGQSGQQLYLTADQGVVRGRATEELLGRSMSGVSLGLRGNWKWLNYDVFVGRPIRVPEGFRTKTPVLGFNLSLSF